MTSQSIQKLNAAGRHQLSVRGTGRRDGCRKRAHEPFTASALLRPDSARPGAYTLVRLTHNIRRDTNCCGDAVFLQLGQTCMAKLEVGNGRAGEPNTCSELRLSKTRDGTQIPKKAFVLRDDDQVRHCQTQDGRNAGKRIYRRRRPARLPLRDCAGADARQPREFASGKLLRCPAVGNDLGAKAAHDSPAHPWGPHITAHSALLRSMLSQCAKLEFRYRILGGNDDVAGCSLAEELTQKSRFGRQLDWHLGGTRTGGSTNRCAS